MVSRINRFSIATAIGAVLLPLATPAAAADFAAPVRVDNAGAFQTFDADAGNTAERSRRGYGGYRGGYRDRDRGIDAGTAIAGVLVLGSIAAILADSSNKRDREPAYEPYPYPEDARYRAQSQQQNGQASGMDRAVDMCVSEVERRGRVGAVDNSSRSGSGWYVSGSMDNGAPWTCRIDNDGRGVNVDYGESYSQSSYPGGPVAGDYSNDYGYSPSVADNQYDETTYGRLRQQQQNGTYTGY